MIFETSINNNPCLCKVIDEDLFTYEILDRRGIYAPWLQKQVTPEILEQLIEEFQIEKHANYYDIGNDYY